MGKTKRWFAVVMALLLLAGTGAVTAEQKANNYCPDGFISVMAFGAKGDGKTDNTDAFKRAAQSSKGIFVPAGEFLISETVQFDSKVMMGAGVGKSVITFTGKDARKPIICAGSYASLRDLTLQFADGLVTGKEKEGDRTAILTGGVWAFQRGASLRRVELRNVGTGVFSPTFDNKIFSDNPSVKEACTFSATFEDVTVRDFSFRGMDFSAPVRTGNVFRNLYFTSKYRANSAVYFDHEESECVIDGIVLEGVTAKQPVYLGNLRAMKMGSLALYDVETTVADNGLVTFSGTNGSIDSLVIRDCRAGNVLFDLERGYYWESGGAVGSQTSFLKIDTLLLDTVTKSGIAGKAFSFFARSTLEIGKDQGGYVVEIDRYLYDSANGDESAYAALKTAGKNLTVTKKGASKL